MSKNRSSDERAWQQYVNDFRRNGLQKIMGSGVCITVYNGDGTDFDVKQATELGAMLLLDKPIIVAIEPGAKIPTRLVKAADIVIENWNIDDPDAHTRLHDAVKDILP